MENYKRIHGLPDSVNVSLVMYFVQKYKDSETSRPVWDDVAVQIRLKVYVKLFGLYRLCCEHWKNMKGYMETWHESVKYSLFEMLLNEFSLIL